MRSEVFIVDAIFLLFFFLVNYNLNSPDSVKYVFQFFLLKASFELNVFRLCLLV